MAGEVDKADVARCAEEVLEGGDVMRRGIPIVAVVPKGSGHVLWKDYPPLSPCWTLLWGRCLLT